MLLSFWLDQILFCSFLTIVCLFTIIDIHASTLAWCIECTYCCPSIDSIWLIQLPSWCRNVKVIEPSKFWLPLWWYPLDHDLQANLREWEMVQVKEHASMRGCFGASGWITGVSMQNVVIVDKYCTVYSRGALQPRPDVGRSSVQVLRVGFWIFYG